MTNDTKMEDKMEKVKMMHIGLSKGDIGRYVFLPGSPERAEKIAAYFDNPKEIAYNREYRTFIGELEGVKVAVTSTGIGGPSAAIAMEELYQCGADTMMRIGTCASTSEKVKTGDIVIPNGAVRMEGVGSHYLPTEFPAVPDYEMLKELEAAAQRLDMPYNIGVTITKASFYSQTAPNTKPVKEDIINSWNAYEAGGATSTSMECAPLFLVAASLGIRASSVLVSATDYKKYDNQDRKHPIGLEDRVIAVGIEAMKSVIRKDRLEVVNKND